MPTSSEELIVMNNLVKIEEMPLVQVQQFVSVSSRHLDKFGFQLQVVIAQIEIISIKQQQQQVMLAGRRCANQNNNKVAAAADLELLNVCRTFAIGCVKSLFCHRRSGQQQQQQRGDFVLIWTVDN
jgi:hypothetical protein